MFVHTGANIVLFFQLCSVLEPALIKNALDVCVAASRHQQIVNFPVHFAKAQIAKYHAIVRALEHNAGFKMFKCFEHAGQIVVGFFKAQLMAGDQRKFTGRWHDSNSPNPRYLRYSPTSSLSAIHHTFPFCECFPQGVEVEKPGYRLPRLLGSSRRVRGGATKPFSSDDSGNSQQPIGLNFHLCTPCFTASVCNEHFPSASVKTQRVFLKCPGLSRYACLRTFVFGPVSPSHSPAIM